MMFRRSVKTPIEHVVIIFQENHSTTNYFGADLGESPKDLGPRIKDPTDLPPGWPTHGAPTMDNADFLFVRQHYTAAELPIYYNWIKRFPLCDNYYAEYNSPSTPNHWALIAADACGIGDNPHGRLLGWFKGQQKRPPFDIPTIPGLLEKHGLTWKNYGMGAFLDFNEIAGSDNHFDSTEFAQDARAGRLPNVSWLVAPRFALTEHTPDTSSDGMHWVASQVQAVLDGKGWKNTAVFVTWDENGGFYDAKQPPLKEVFEQPKRGIRFWLPKKRQLRWGPRCSCIVLNAFAKQPVDGQAYRPGKEGQPDKSHVSLLRFIVDNFGLDTSSLRPSQRQRLEESSSMMDCFDFKQQPAAPPIARLSDLHLRDKVMRFLGRRQPSPATPAQPTTPAVPGPKRELSRVKGPGGLGL